MADSRREKAERVRWEPDTREEAFALLSKRGFVEELANELDDSWSLFSPDELDELLA